MHKIISLSLCLIASYSHAMDCPDHELFVAAVHQDHPNVFRLLHHDAVFPIGILPALTGRYNKRYGFEGVRELAHDEKILAYMCEALDRKGQLDMLYTWGAYCDARFASHRAVDTIAPELQACIKNKAAARQLIIKHTMLNERTPTLLHALRNREING